MDYAIWYPEAIPHSRANSKNVIKELFMLCSLFKIPKEILGYTTVLPIPQEDAASGGVRWWMWLGHHNAVYSLQCQRCPRLRGALPLLRWCFGGSLWVCMSQRRPSGMDWMSHASIVLRHMLEAQQQEAEMWVLTFLNPPDNMLCTSMSWKFTLRTKMTTHISHEHISPRLILTGFWTTGLECSG